MPRVSAAISAPGHAQQGLCCGWWMSAWPEAGGRRRPCLSAWVQAPFSRVSGFWFLGCRLMPLNHRFCDNSSSRSDSSWPAPQAPRSLLSPSTDNNHLNYCTVFSPRKFHNFKSNLYVTIVNEKKTRSSVINRKQQINAETINSS